MRNNSFTVLSRNEKDTQKIGECIFSAFIKSERDNIILGLKGDLGAGKTFLTKYIAKASGIDEEFIISPSFMLLREYKKNTTPVFHFDLFRIVTENELKEVGFEDYLENSGIIIIEWEEKAKNILKYYERVEIGIIIKSESSREFDFNFSFLDKKIFKEELKKCLYRLLLTQQQ